MSQGGVLHVFGELAAHGAELRTLEQLAALHDRGEGRTQHVLTLSGRAGELEERFRAAGVDVHVGRVRSARFPFLLRDLIRRHGISIVHSHVDNLSGYLMLVAAWAGAPGRISHFRSDRLNHRAGAVAAAKDAVLRRLIRRHSTAIAAVSPTALAQAWPGAEHDPRAIVLLSGVGLDRFAVTAPIETPHVELGVSAAAQLIMHIGRDVPGKNRPLAVAVLERLLQREADVALCVVGETTHDSRATLLRGVPDAVARRVVFTGHRDDVPRLLRAASATICTSMYEGIPGAVLESMVAGTPVVSSDLPGTRYLIEHLAPAVIVPDDAGIDAWADAVLAVATPVDLVPGRPDRVSEVTGGPFDARTAVDGLEALWERSLGGARA